MSGKILLVEDRDSLRRMLATALGQEGYEVVAVADAESGIEEVKAVEFDLVLTDLKLPGASGLAVVEASREARPRVPVIVLTAHGTVQTAVDAMKSGATDFLEKPIEIEELFAIVAAHLQGPDGLRDSDSVALEIVDGPTIIGRHPLMRAALKLLERVSATESTVLLTGESGTGKELFAQAVHGLSPRSSGPFVAVNCAAIPEALLENELFGHEKGAFTGAHRRQAGRFEQAQGGSLFLDEVGELGAAVQSKVLRVLEERTFERVGGGATIKADVRLVAATNRPLRQMVDAGDFRSDLYFRLEVFPIELPPLRERPSDIALLARHLLERIAGKHNREALRLTAGAARLLEQQSWPGNVRQLSNVLERAVILAEGEKLGSVELRPLLEVGAHRDEKRSLEKALEETRGDKRAAATVLGISYRTLQRKVKEHDLAGYPKYRS